MPDESPDLHKLSLDDQVERSTFDKTGGDSLQPPTVSRPRATDARVPPAPFPQVSPQVSSTADGGASGESDVELPSLDFDAAPTEDATASASAPAPQAAHSPYGRGPDMVASAGPMYQSQPTWRQKIPGAQYAPTLPQVLLALLVAGGLYVWRNWNREVVPTEVDKGLVVGAEWLAERSREFEFLPSAEQLVKHSSLLGGMRLDYYYLSGEAGQPELQTTIRIYPSAAEAAEAFKAVELANRLAWQHAGQGSIGISEFDEDCTWGDESRAYMVEVRGVPFGHSFYARMGKRRIDVTIRGVVFRDGWELFQVLKPALRNLAAYRP